MRVWSLRMRFKTDLGKKSERRTMVGDWRWVLGIKTEIGCWGWCLGCGLRLGLTWVWDLGWGVSWGSSVISLGFGPMIKYLDSIICAPVCRKNRYRYLTYHPVGNLLSEILCPTVPCHQAQGFPAPLRPKRAPYQWSNRDMHLIFCRCFHLVAHKRGAWSYDTLKMAIPTGF